MLEAPYVGFLFRCYSNPYIGQSALQRFAVDLGHARIEPLAPIVEPDGKRGIDRDGDILINKHRLERGLGEQIVAQGSIRSAAFNPDGARCQSLSQMNDDGDFIGPSIHRAILKNEFAPADPQKSKRDSGRQCPPVGPIHLIENGHCRQNGIVGLCRPEGEWYPLQ